MEDSQAAGEDPRVDSKLDIAGDQDDAPIFELDLIIVFCLAGASGKIPLDNW